ncbi:MAG: iron-containing alcohol dehydrogenase [Spirochaetaceae bacterium]
MNFNFESPAKIIFGSGKVKELLNIIKPLTDNIIVITGKSNRFTYILDNLEENGIKCTVFNVGQEPLIEDVDTAVDLARSKSTDLVLALGGGSVIDTAKAVSIMLLNPGTVLDYLEVIGGGQTLYDPSIPCIAVPTTSGTGSEVTKNSVLKSVEHNRKVSMRSPFMIPEIVIIDPELTLTVPKDVTFYTGMDALTQVIEPYLSNQSNHFTDLLCKDAILKAVPALKDLNKNLQDLKAREDMSYVSLIGGLALANAKLGAVHGFAGPMGGLYNIPHGLICAILLPRVLKVNYYAVIKRGTVQQLNKFKELATILTGHDDPNLAIKIVEDLTKELNIPNLSKFGIKKEDIDNIVLMSKDSSSMKGNTILLTEDELYQIIELSL